MRYQVFSGLGQTVYTWRAHLSAFWAAAGAEQRARSTGSTSSLSKLSEIRAGMSLNFDKEHQRRAPPAKGFSTKLDDSYAYAASCTKRYGKYN